MDNRQINIACRAETCTLVRVLIRARITSGIVRKIYVLPPFNGHVRRLVAFFFSLSSSNSQIAVGGRRSVAGYFEQDSKQLLAGAVAAVGSGLEFQKRVFDVKVNGGEDFSL